LTDEKIRQSNDKNGAGFMYLKHKFTRLRDAKIKEELFVGPQIREIIQINKLENS
jgi:hypothetical protein